MIAIVDAIYCMVGDALELPNDENTPHKRVDRIFAQMDTVSGRTLGTYRVSYRQCLP